jgi:hypothetical protein
MLGKMNGLAGEDLLELPEDPNLAFLAIEERARERVARQLAESEDSHFDDSIRRNYIITVVAAADALEIHDLHGASVPRVGDETLIQFQQLVNDVAGFAVRVRIQSARRARKFSVALDQPTKRKLRHLLKQIREVVDKLEVSDQKRERLYCRVAELEEEVNRNRTRLEVVASLAISISETSGKVAKNLEPLWKWVHPLLGLIGKAQEREEVPSVPQLPSPPRQIEAPKWVPASPKEKSEARQAQNASAPMHTDRLEQTAQPKSKTEDEKT